jgi:signal peptidase I
MNAAVKFNPDTKKISLSPFTPPKAVDRGRSGRPFFKRLLQYALFGAMACGSYFFVSHFILESVKVVGVSMVPTLHDSDLYLLNRWIYLVRDPQPSDIVVIRDPTDRSYAVKRNIAGAGDLVYLKNGRIYVNGRELREPYLDPGTPTYTLAKANETLVRCGKDQYFVLGDNRSNSNDSRAYGPVPRQSILGLIAN